MFTIFEVVRSIATILGNLRGYRGLDGVVNLLNACFIPSSLSLDIALACGMRCHASQATSDRQRLTRLELASTVQGDYAGWLARYDGASPG